MSATVASIRPPAAIYREEQYFAWWLYALLAVMVGLGWLTIAWSPRGANGAAAAARGPWLEVPFSMLIGLLLPPVLVVGVLRMTTEVTAIHCRVWYGMVPTFRRALDLDSVKRVEIVRYNAIRDHWFWGVRITRDGERVLTARGDRGVRLYLHDGSRVLIGSQRPEELAEVLERAIRPVS